MAKYGFFLSPDKTQIFAVKTTVSSPVDADWDSIDDPVLPNSYAPFQSIIKSIWCFEDGTNIHVGHQLKNGHVGYSIFSTSSDTWTTRDESVGLVGATNFDEAAAETELGCAIAVDGAGIVIVIAAYQPTGSNTRLRCFRKSGGSWSNQGNAGAASNESMGPVIYGPDTSDRISWGYLVTSDGSFRIRSISSGGTISSETTADSTVANTGLSAAPGGINSNTIHAPYVDSNNDVSIATWTSGASPSISTVVNVSDEGDVRFAADAINVQPVMGVGLDGATPHLIYADASTSDLRHNDDVSGTGGTETEVKDAVTVSRVSVNKGTTDLLYFYDDGDDQIPHFDVVTLSGGAQNLTPTGLASALAFGTAVVTTGAVNLDPTAITSGLAFGAPLVTHILDPPGIASGVVFGAPTVTVGAVNLDPPGIASAVAFGAATITTGSVDLQPTGLVSGIAFGAPTIVLKLEPLGVASGVAFGAATVAPGAVDLQPGGLPTGIAFGAPTVTSTYDLQPTGLASGIVFGGPAITTGAVELQPTGLASAVAYGAPAITSSYDLLPAGVASGSAFGGPSLTTGAVDLQPAGLSPGIDFGAPLMLPGPVDLQPTGLASIAAFGLPSIGFAQIHGLAPSWRLAVIPAEVRTATPPAEDRSILLAKETRVASILAAARTT